MYEQLKKGGVSGGFIVVKQVHQPKGYATMDKNSVIELEGRAGRADPLTELRIHQVWS